MIRPRMTGHSAVASAVAVALILTAAVLATFFTAPKNEDFWWTDAATFALNGELIRDYVAHGLGQSPLAFASNWFLYYPALTISLYPPIFPMTEAIAFSVFGFSHGVAQAVVSLFALICAFGCWSMVRSAVPSSAAAAATLLLLASPGVLLWSRQVMMEVPTLAFLLLAAAMLLSHQAEERPWKLFAVVALLVAAVYTKQTAIFAAVAFGLALLLQHGTRLLCAKSTWIAIAGGIVALIPLFLFTLKFAAQNIDSAIGEGTASGPAGTGASHISWFMLTAYGLALPEIAGWLTIAGAAGYVCLIVIGRCTIPAERRLVWLMIAWFCADYVFISVIGHFEARYGIFLAAPVAVLCALFMWRITPERLRSVLPICVAGAIFVGSVYTHRIPRRSGYDNVAAFIASHTTKGDVVLLDCYESKNFVFSMRVRAPEPQVLIVRAEKIFVDYNILREWGITDRDISTEDIDAMIDKIGISYVVMQPDFWSDLPSMARLQKVVQSDRFSEVASFPIESDEVNQRMVIRVYKNNRSSSTARGGIDMNMRALGGTISLPSAKPR